MFPLVHQLALAAAIVFLRGEQHQEEEEEEERVLLIPERRRKQPQGNKKSRTTTNAELGPEVHMEELVATAAMMHENSLLPSEFRLLLLLRLQLDSRISC